MKGKVLLSLLVIALAGTLVAGAMGAWFTGEAEVPAAEFTAGTVIVNADGPEYFPAEGKSFENVNPGDCGKVVWDIINAGSKAAELRVKLDELWEDGLSTNNFYYAPEEGSGWVLYEETEGEEQGLWLYYTGGPVPGTFNDDASLEDRTVKLPLIVAFDGEATGNEYQGKEFTLSGKVYAVQASNGAPGEVWKAFNTVMDPEYVPTGKAAEYIEYIKGTPCGGGQVQPPPTPVVTRIVVNGPDRVKENRTAQYTATVYDQNDEVMEGQTVTWSIERRGYNQGRATIDQNGLMYANDDGYVYVRATIGDVYGEIRVTIWDD